MSGDLHALEAWAGALLARLQPAQRRAINHKVAIDLRRSQAQRIKAQQGPDGAAYPARKRRKEFKGKNGRIKRQKAEMFAKIKTYRFLKIKTTSTEISIGFFGRVARIARIHHEGRSEYIGRNHVPYKYSSRPLIGLNAEGRILITRSLLKHMNT